MKNWLILLLLPLKVFSQDADVNLPVNKDGNIEYTEVVTVDSATAEQMYSRVRLYIAQAFRSSTDVTKLEDEKTHTIVTKGYLPRNYVNPLYATWGGAVFFSFTIQCKDGRYRYSITDLEHRDHLHPEATGGRLERVKPACPGIYMSKNAWKKIKRETNDHLISFIHLLKDTMEGNTSAADNSW